MIINRNQAELLSLFLTNPEKEYYLNEIGRILNKKPGVFQRTINKMASEGVLLSEFRANARYFKANTEYPFFDELKSIVNKTAGMPIRIKGLIDKIKEVDFAFIYGSFAKGMENGLSDIDVLIIGKPDEGLLAAEFDRLERSLQREINYKIYSPADYENGIRQGNPFLNEVMSGRIIMLTGREDELRKIH